MLQMHSKMHVKREPRAPDDAPFFLVGKSEELGIMGIKLDGKIVPGNRYSWVRDDLLKIKGPMGRRWGKWVAAAEFVLECDVKIGPELNNEICRAYSQGGDVCIQCEAESLSRLTLVPCDVHARFLRLSLLLLTCLMCWQGIRMVGICKDVSLETTDSCVSFGLHWPYTSGRFILNKALSMVLQASVDVCPTRNVCALANGRDATFDGVQCMQKRRYHEAAQRFPPPAVYQW
jgi:hypothetical protein